MEGREGEGVTRTQQGTRDTCPLCGSPRNRRTIQTHLGPAMIQFCPHGCRTPFPNPQWIDPRLEDGWRECQQEPRLTP